MSTDPKRLSVRGLTVRFDPDGGRIDDLIIETPDSEKPLRPLHRAPWVDDAENLPDTIAPVERRLAGDFFCAPFGNQPGQPIHGWTANGQWTPDGVSTDEDGAVTARYVLEKAVNGARVEKQLALQPGHPFLYQCHRFTGGSGHLPIAHHAMIRVPGGARLSFSDKRFGITPADPLENDPARGQSLLAYPQRFTTLSKVATADGGAADATRYPFRDTHEDIVVLTEATPGIGWSAALAAEDGFLFFAIKDARRLPETLLWMSNGGRHYAPWLSRHTHVLGIEEAATSCHIDGHFTSTPDPDENGLATGLTLGTGEAMDIRYGFGAIAVPPGWTQVVDIQLARKTLTLIDVGGGKRTLPFDDTHFAL